MKMWSVINSGPIVGAKEQSVTFLIFESLIGMKTPTGDHRVSIIIVNWNSGGLLLEAVRSIATHYDSAPARVIIVDNASTDCSLDALQSAVGLPFTPIIVRNETNNGFGAACNQGAALAVGDYLLFLNPDTRLFENSLSKPLAFMDDARNGNVGICGIQLLDESNRPSTSAARFPTVTSFAAEALGLTKLFPKIFQGNLIKSLDKGGSGTVDQIIGAFFLIRRTAFEACAGFDEQFFVYFEEVDLSLRVKKLGLSSHLFTDATAFHKGGGSSEKVKAARLFYSLRSRIKFAAKHFTPAQTAAVISLLPVEFTTRVARAVLNRSGSEIIDTARAYWWLIRSFVGAKHERIR